MAYVRRPRKTKVYRASQDIATKLCANCGQKIRPGQMIKFSRDSIQRRSAPQHTVCPQRHVEVRFVT